MRHVRGSQEDRTLTYKIKQEHNHDILCNKPDRTMVDKQLYCLHWDVELMDPHTHYVAGPADLLGEAWPGKLRQMSWAEESVQEEAQTGADPISKVWK